MSIKFTAQIDETNLDFMPFRVLETTDNSGRILCRCNSLADAQRIAAALGGEGIEVKSYNELMAQIDEALGKTTKPPAPQPIKMRVTL